ncbi:MAG: sigma-70 family RNA polymerase sigma factor [Sandaracinus sp.]|nr:sigma-70 family RNA polymerase sigma factor [Sandaracinus sp.]MCB9614950.1 sigma-70 family RNA polymerase sigma factor [Sandaracinus sp.]MCB9622121.1 sigma-70 family RNA polymerase sigma factor [Sandaracinus sp.]MCB9630588.1 sigma-70 family RNA polymerase sigma factor [Sandaracinus sp.]
MTIRFLTPDLELMDRVARRDDGAWNELSTRFERRIRQQCRRVVGSGPDLDDAVQSAFLQILVCAHRFEGRGRLDGWILRIARWTALELRYGRRDRFPSAMLPDDLPAAPTADPHAVPDNVTRLDDVCRESVVLHYWMGMTVPETAEHLDCSPNTVKSRLKRSLRLLREAIEAETARERRAA